ncbi:hypothetical protein KAH37_09135 [bacterium]|nr:hypothetical protein [bacterium]
MIKKRNFIFYILLVLLLTSCSQAFTLDGLGESGDEEQGSDSDIADTGDAGDTVDSGNTADTADTANTGNTADTGDTLDSADSADTADSANTGNSGNSTLQDDDEFPDTDMTDPSAFPDDFNLAQCECGELPQHEPVCCNKTVSVYNICFANCFAYHSNRDKILCDEYVESLCAPSENLFPDQDILSDEDYTNDQDLTAPDSDITLSGDNDNEIPDEDKEDECGCYPDDFQAWCCNDGVVYISKCLADCHCSRNYILCPSQ